MWGLRDLVAPNFRDTTKSGRSPPRSLTEFAASIKRPGLRVPSSASSSLMTPQQVLSVLEADAGRTHASSTSTARRRGLKTHDSTTSLDVEQEVDPTALVDVDVPNPPEILHHNLLSNDATVLNLDTNEICRL